MWDCGAQAINEYSHITSDGKVKQGVMTWKDLLLWSFMFGLLDVPVFCVLFELVISSGECWGFQVKNS